MKETIHNELVFIEYLPDEKEIFARDLTDQNNDPAMYTITRRNIKKAWQSIKDRFSDDTKISDVVDILRVYNIKKHYWCMVD